MQDSIWIREVIPYGKTKYKIIPENVSAFALYRKEVLHYQIKPQSILSAQDYEEILKLLEKRGRLRAMHLLEKKDYSSCQLRKKLLESYYPEEVVDKVVIYLEGLHYLDDERYVNHFVQYHCSEWNSRQIRQKLLERGLKGEMVDKALEECSGPSELELARRLLEKRHFDRNTAGEKEIEKTVRYLKGRGYSFEVIRELVL